MSIIKSTWDLLKFAIVVLVVAFLLKAAVFQPFVVDGSSMEPSYHNMEYLVINKISFRLFQPRRGNVVIIRPPDHPELTYIKRVIGLPGETIKINEGNVYIDGKLLKENYLTDNGKTYVDSEKEKILETKLGKTDYFVMGDNRAHSTDSRYFGIVPRGNFVGKAWLNVYPAQYFGFSKHNGYSLVPVS